jgi:AraC-like DNA-binding protein
MIQRDMHNFSIDRPILSRDADVVSDVVSLLNLRASFLASLTTGGEWAIAFPRGNGLAFTAVVRGGCKLAVDGVDEPVELQSGDCYLLITDSRHRLASDLTVEAADARTLYAQVKDGRARHGPGQDCVLIGGRFNYDGDGTDGANHIPILLKSLPQVVLIRGNRQDALNVRWILERLTDELSARKPGGALILDHLAQMLFVQMLRAKLASGETLPVGWLGALADDKIGLALTLIHQNPGRKWTLLDLTTATGMSRSLFSARFKALVGTAPLDYLLRWRIQLAARELRRGTERVAAIAKALGYESESAFGNAFKRVMGKAPKRYQKDSLDEG